MVCTIKGRILDIQVDKYKEDIFKIDLYQKGIFNLIRIGGVPKSDINKFQEGQEISVNCNVSVYCPKDSEKSFLVTRYLGKA